MAEGWAREWIRLQMEDQPKSSPRRILLERLVIASVALDAAAVFKGVVPSNAIEEECCSDPCKTPKQRKEVKGKAIAAMKEDGVDISSCVPKTINEILPKLQQPGSLSSIICTTEKPIDNLIILCSCGDDVKRTLLKKSRDVQEWNVDAPTACAKSGEGNSAYRRVSLEIKEQVNELLLSIIKEEEASEVGKSCA